MPRVVSFLAVGRTRSVLFFTFAELVRLFEPLQTLFHFFVSLGLLTDPLQRGRIAQMDLDRLERNLTVELLGQLESLLVAVRRLSLAALFVLGTKTVAHLVIITEKLLLKFV